MLEFLHRRKHSPAFSLAIAALFVSLAAAIFETVWAVYLDSFLHDASLVGFIAAGVVALQVLWTFFSTPYVERWPEREVFLYSVVALFAGYVLFFLLDSLWGFLAVTVVLVFPKVLRVETFAVLVRDNSADDGLGEAEGINYALRNVGWLVGPLVGGFVSAQLGVRFAFLFGALFLLVAALYFRTLRVDVADHDDADASLRAAFTHLKEYFARKDLVQAYFMNGGMSLWWGVLYTYAPLYIIRSGLAEWWVGVFLFAIIVPLVTLELPVGRWADRAGYKPFFLAGYAILALCAFIAFFLSPLLSLLFLAFASVGAACLEGTREGYYFLLSGQRDEEKYLGTYLTASPLSSVLGKLVVAGVLLLFPIQYFFLALGVLMLVYVGVASTVPRVV